MPLSSVDARSCAKHRRASNFFTSGLHERAVPLHLAIWGKFLFVHTFAKTCNPNLELFEVMPPVSHALRLNDASEGRSFLHLRDGPLRATEVALISLGCPHGKAA